jgi:hypothetical protein
MICKRVLRARAISAAAAGRWPKRLLQAVEDAYRAGATLAVTTTPGFDLGTVHAFLDLGLAVRHSAANTAGWLVLDHRDGWLIGSHLPLDHPRLRVRALEHGHVAEWVRFYGRVDRADPASQTFAIEGFPHVTLHGDLPANCGVPGVLVRVTGLRSLALGEEAYHPHTLHVVEVVPRAEDGLFRRVDAAVRGASSGEAMAPEWDAILRQRGFAGQEDLEAYLLDNGISRAAVSEAIAAVAPRAGAAVTNVMAVLIAGMLQMWRDTPAALLACAPILQALLRPASSARLADDLIAAAEALLYRASQGVSVISARPDEILFTRLNVLTQDIEALSGRGIVTAVIEPGHDDGSHAAGHQPAAIRRLSAASSDGHSERTGPPGVVLAADAAAWTQHVLGTVMAEGTPQPVRIGLNSALRSIADICLPRYVGCRLGTHNGRPSPCRSLDAVTILIRAVRVTRDARLRERRPPGPIAPRTGA